MMNLRYLPANAAYVFTFGDSLIRMGDAPMFHATRGDAVRAARACGLAIARNGRVDVYARLAADA